MKERHWWAQGPPMGWIIRSRSRLRPRRMASRQREAGDDTARKTLLLRSFVVFGDFVPVHYIPESLEIIGAAILVFEIIGVFPNVAAEKRLAFSAADGLAHDRVVLVCRGNNLKFAVVHDEPDPTAAETRPAPPASNFSLKASKLPKVALMSSASLPEGAPPALGAISFQNIE